ncbi:MAG: hypothetical protein ACI4D3_02875 [Lachnospiraceae bacterium]
MIKQKRKISQAKIQHGAKLVVYDKTRLDFGREKGPRPQPAFRTYSCRAEPYQSVRFTDDIVCGGKTCDCFGTDLDNSCVRPCFDVCIGGFGVCEYKFEKLKVKSQEAINSNRAAAEAVWTTLTELTQNILGFVIYVVLLSSVQPLLILVILITTVISFFAENYVNEWGYRHREEEAEYENQMLYLDRCASDLTAAKDIRIFGLRPWLEELYSKAMGTYTAFQKKAQGIYIWAKIADPVLTFLRNSLQICHRQSSL